MLTIVLLLVLAGVVGVQGMRQVVYLSLHISYCLRWLLEQWLFPERARQLFSERVGVVGFGFALLVGEGARQDQDLLAVTVAMALEGTAGGLAHDRDGPGPFCALAIEHASLHASHRRGGPARRAE